jgi:hypothetical protein
LIFDSNSLGTPNSSPYNGSKMGNGGGNGGLASPRHRNNGGTNHRNNSSKDDDGDSLDGSTSPSPPTSVLAPATSLRSPSNLMAPSSGNPYGLPPAFSSALGGLSALTSGLTSVGAPAPHPPLTPSPSSDSPQQQDAPGRAPNSSQQSWTFEEQFKQVSTSFAYSMNFQ